MQSAMVDDCTGIRLARDQRDQNLASGFPDIPPSADLRAPVTGIGHAASPHSPSTKRKGTLDNDHRPLLPPPRISIAPDSLAFWSTQVPNRPNKRTHVHLQQDPHLQPEQNLTLHQSTCLNFNPGTTHTDETELLILPDFDEWELDSSASTTHSSNDAPPRKSGDRAPLVSRAVNSNRERLRRRLEGDGWDFVCGRYGEDAKMLRELTNFGEESVDEEFDVVVLPNMVRVSC